MRPILPKKLCYRLQDFDLSFELTDPFLRCRKFDAFRCRDAGPLPSINLVLACPLMDRGGADAELVRDGRDGFAGSDERDSPHSELDREWSWIDEASQRRPIHTPFQVTKPWGTSRCHLSVQQSCRLHCSLGMVSPPTVRGNLLRDPQTIAAPRIEGAKNLGRFNATQGNFIKRRQPPPTISPTTSSKHKDSDPQYTLESEEPLMKLF